MEKNKNSYLYKKQLRTHRVKVTPRKEVIRA